MILEGLSIFFPSYNEEANVERVVREALRVAPKTAKDYEIVVVDDGSKDRTSEIVRSLARENSKVRLVRHETNKGYGEALKSGFRAAKMPWVFYTDGDGQFDLNELPELAARTSDTDIVSGYRAHRADPWHRKLNAAIFALALRVFMGLRVRDVDCAFKLYRRELFDRIQLNTSGALIDAEVLTKAIRAGYRVASMPVSHKPRIAGSQTGAKCHVIFRAMKEFCQLWWDLRKMPVRR
jgi:glycosyltransferase involved in cell wall biosynthesis